MKKTKTLVLMAVFVALNYVGTMVNIPFTFGGAKTMIHFGNVFCFLGAFCLGGFSGGLSAAIGQSLFDIFNGWGPYAPSTFILKLIMGLIAGYSYKLLSTKTKMNNLVCLIISAVAATLGNFILDPIFASYLTHKYILGLEADTAMIVAGWDSFAVIFNGLIASAISIALFKVLGPILKKFEK